MCDQLLIKYWATLAGYAVMWIPILLNKDPNKTSGELTRDYARVSRYLQNVSAAVGELGSPRPSLLPLFARLT